MNAVQAIELAALRKRDVELRDLLMADPHNDETWAEASQVKQALSAYVDILLEDLEDGRRDARAVKSFIDQIKQTDRIYRPINHTWWRKEPHRGGYRLARANTPRDLDEKKPDPA